MLSKLINTGISGIKLRVPVSLSDGLLCFTGKMDTPASSPTVLCTAFAASPPLAVLQMEQKQKKRQTERE